jgi:uncharacterized protein
MLLEFEVANYRSFNQVVRLSMQAAKPIKEFSDSNTFEVGDDTLLKTAAIYGANASGKSNLLNAMGFMGWFVLNSSKEMQIEDEIPTKPFKLDASTIGQPSHFQVCFLQNGLRYRYGFDVDTAAVRKEWLFVAKKHKESVLFLREEDGIEVGEDFMEGKGLEDKTRNNALFLSVVAQFNGETSVEILKWFKSFRKIHGLRDQNYEKFSVGLLQMERIRKVLLKLVHEADIGIDDIKVDEMDSPESEDELLLTNPAIDKSKLNTYRVTTLHTKWKNGKKDGFTEFDFINDESSGTKKFFRIAGPVIESLALGYVLVIDELDAKLHPLLTKAIINLFNSRDSNPKNAQLIFAVHDTNLLMNANLRRDQIWFTEKNKQGATDLYSLAEIKVRNDANFEKNYIQGRYGAIPFIGDMKSLFKEDIVG